MLLLLTALATLTQRIDAHLLIGDVEMANQEILYVDDPKLLEAKLRVFAKMGKQREMLAVWDEISKSDSTCFQRSDLMETMAWGIIDKGFSDSSPLIRAIALIAAKTSSTSHGVTLLLRGMQDSSALVRLIATELCKGMRDVRLQERVILLLQSDSSREVRLAAIRTIGTMHATGALPTLRAILESSSHLAEEKAAAAASFAELASEPDRGALQKLSSSGREGLRLMACEWILAFQLTEQLDLVLPLLKDHSQLVRKVAIQLLALLGKERAVEPPLSDPQFRVRSLSAWLLMVREDKRGGELLLNTALAGEEEERLFAAACLASCARHSIEELKTVLKKSPDPLVRLNAAIGLISQREMCEEAAKAIADALESYPGRLMWKDEGAIRYAAPSDVRFKGDIPQYPEVVNQLVRLELYQLLSYVDFPEAVVAFRRFLEERTLQTTGIVIALMLTEGGSESLDAVRPLLQDPDSKTRAQAALILALWGREESVIKELEAIYLNGDRLTKEKVLEGIGSIGSKQSLPFLVERLSEPQQHLRMIAAAALIECLNH